MVRRIFSITLDQLIDPILIERGTPTHLGIYNNVAIRFDEKSKK